MITPRHDGTSSAPVPGPAIGSRSPARGGVELGALGAGCWAIGGPWTMHGSPAGWGAVDDDESVRALHAAMAGGVRFFDTAATYGAGHSERVLGRAVAGRRDEVVLATKFGYVVDEAGRNVDGVDVRPAAVREACAASLRRLGTDHLDLFQLHVGDLDPALAEPVIEVLDALVADGAIRAFGVSTDDVELARTFLAAPGCVAVQHQLNVLQDSPDLLALCASARVASINRGPLAMGLLAGRRTTVRRFPDDDLRAHGAAWMPYFIDGRPAPDWAQRVAAVSEILTAGGRTLAQGAIGWIWARSPVTVPIPGVRTVAQAEDNAAALGHGPLDRARMDEIAAVLRHREG